MLSTSFGSHSRCGAEKLKEARVATFETHKSCQAATLDDEVALLEKLNLSTI